MALNIVLGKPKTGKSTYIYENIEKLIVEHIDFTNLAIDSVQATNEPYKSTSEIYLKLKEMNTINETQIDEILKSLEGATDEI